MSTSANIPNASGPNTGQIVLRIIASIFGGYVFVWGCASLGIAGLTALGSNYHHVEIGLSLVGFLIYLSAFLWAYSARRVTLVWLVLFGGGAGMSALAWALQQQLIN